MAHDHTPGPWRIGKGLYGALHIGPAKLDHPGREAAQYAAARGQDLLAQRDADARLIAAAPDMLTALESLLGIAETIDDDTMGAALANARAIIAQAKGAKP